MKKIVNCTNQNVHIESITIKPGRPVFIQDDAISISFNRKMTSLQQINFIKVFNEPDPIQPPVVVEQPEPTAEEPVVINEVEKVEIAEVKEPVMEVIEEQKEEIQSKRKKKATTTKKQEPKEEQEDKEVE